VRGFRVLPGRPSSPSSFRGLKRYAHAATLWTAAIYRRFCLASIAPFRPNRAPRRSIAALQSVLSPRDRRRCGKRLPRVVLGAGQGFNCAGTPAEKRRAWRNVSRPGGTSDNSPARRHAKHGSAGKTIPAACQVPEGRLRPGRSETLHRPSETDTEPTFSDYPATKCRAILGCPSVTQRRRPSRVARVGR